MCPPPASLIYFLLWTCHLHPAVSVKSVGHTVLYLGLFWEVPVGGHSWVAATHQPGTQVPHPWWDQDQSKSVKTILLWDAHPSNIFCNRRWQVTEFWLKRLNGGWRRTSGKLDALTRGTAAREGLADTTPSSSSCEYILNMHVKAGVLAAIWPSCSDKHEAKKLTHSGWSRTPGKARDLDDILKLPPWAWDHLLLNLREQ